MKNALYWAAGAWYALTLLAATSCDSPTPHSVSTAPAAPAAKPVEAPPIVDIRQVAGKTPAEVAKVLGEPEATEKVKPSGTPCPCTKNIYQQEGYEVVFMNGKADWIQVLKVEGLPFNEQALALIGLPPTKPTFTNPQSVMRWESIPGFNSVSVFTDGDGKISYAYIKTVTN